VNIFLSAYKLDVVIVEGVSTYDPFHEAPETESAAEGGHSSAGGAASGGPRPSRRSEEDSPYKVIWSVLRSILEIIIDVVI